MQPRLIVEVAGLPVRPDQGRVIAAKVRRVLSQPAQCEVELVDATVDVTLGATLVLRLDDGVEPLFEGDVTATEHEVGPNGARTLRVRGYDALHRLRKRQRIRSYARLDTAALAQAVVEEIGIAQVTAHARGPVVEFRAQHGQDDLELLDHACYRAGLYHQLVGPALVLFSGEGYQDGPELRWGEALMEARAEQNADRWVESIDVSGWDARRAAPTRAAAGSARTGRVGPRQPSASAVGGHGLRVLTGLMGDEDELAAHAQAELDAGYAAGITVEGVARGDPALRPGLAVTISGVGVSVDGRHVLSTVTHSLDAERGFWTELGTALPSRPRSTAPALSPTLGEIVDVDDPDGWGRVRVRLLAYDGLESDWLPVITPGAGSGRGLVVCPKTSDRVLVLLLDGGRGVVIGGFFGPHVGSSDAFELGDTARLVWSSGEGQRLMFDDQHRVARLQQADGSFVELGPDKTTLHAAGDLVISTAPGRRMQLRAGKIDFEQV